jgi:hypothetical protein
MIKTLFLILILLLAFFMAFIPHIGYAYPVHLDEWIHLAHSKALIEAGSINYPDPFSGKAATGLLSSQEVNYHLLLASLSEVSGIDWLVLFRFGPSLVFMLTVLAVYVLCRKEGYELEAAFFTCLIPTTIGLMGPAFMVPVALGLAFIPLCLFTAFRVKSWPSYLMLFIITCFLWLLHPPTAAVLYIVIAPYILINLKGNWRRSIGLSTALLAPLLLALPWMWSKLLPAIGKLQVSQALPAYVDIPALLVMYGLLPLILCFIGVIYLARRGDRQSYGLIFGLTLLLLAGLIFLWFQYGIYILYGRSLHTALLLLGILAGAGLMWVRKLKAPTGNILCSLLVVVTLTTALPSRLNYPFYRMIGDEDYRAFSWIRDNIGGAYQQAALETWKGTAFTAITGFNVLRRTAESESALADGLIHGYLRDGCENSAFLLDNKITLVYSRLFCNNTKLLKIRENVYLASSAMWASFSAPAPLKNGGFEAVNGNPPANWGERYSNSNPSFLFPQPGRGGGNCVGIILPASAPLKPLPTARWQQSVSVQTGHTYIIGGWIKTREIVGQGGARLALQWRNAEVIGIKSPDIMPYVRGTSDWTYFTYRATAPLEAAVCFIWLELAGCSGTAWFDDVVFRAE